MSQSCAKAWNSSADSQTSVMLIPSSPTATTWKSPPGGGFPSQSTTMRSASYSAAPIPSHFMDIITAMCCLLATTGAEKSLAHQHYGGPVAADHPDLVR